MVHCNSPSDINVHAKLWLSANQGFTVVLQGLRAYGLAGTRCFSFVSSGKVEVASTLHVVVLGLGILWLPIKWTFSFPLLFLHLVFFLIVSNLSLSLTIFCLFLGVPQ